MSSFNEYFRSTGAKIIVDRFFDGADTYNKKYKITKVDYEILDEPPYPASYYIENELTASFKVQVKYITNNDGEWKYCTFEIPKEVDGAFIIEGSYRIQYNKLSPDFDCRIRMSGTGTHIINFDFDRQYDIEKKVLRIKKTYQSTDPMKKDIEIKYDDIDGLEGDKKELLKLNEKQQKKFQIKLDIDYKPEYITTKLINDCLAFGDDRLKDLIIDKQIENVSTGLMQYLFKSNNRRNFYAAKRKIAGYFLKNNRIQDKVNPITTLAFRYFKGTQETKKGDSNIQVPPGINAINLESISSKVTISNTTAYNSTFSDLIDFADTPINNNTNLQNSLTVSTHITDDGILFDVFDKTFTKITIPYIDYLNSKVCASEFVDYETRSLKPDKDGNVVVKYRMRRKTVPASEIDLIDLHPDYRLSATTRRIPFINSTDSVRISMGCSMLKQSIPLANAERPLVDTGNNEELHDNVFNEKFKYDKGKVTKIDENKVVIQLPDGTDTEVLRRTALQSMNDISVYSEPKVKVGQVVKKDDIICGAVGLEKDTYKAGLNTLVLFHAMFGLVNEDALVVSESYAKRMTHYSIIDLSIPVKTSTSLKWIAPIGTKVKSGSEIVTLFKTVRLNEVNKALTEKLGGLFGEDGEDLTQYTTEEYLKVPNNIDEAYVSDVMVQENIKPIIPKSVKAPDYTLAHQSEKVIKEYEASKDRKIIYDKFPEYVAADTLDPIMMDRDKYKVVYNVRIRLIKVTGLMVGSKVTNRYGGKGVISKILPDELMPIMVDKNTNRQYRVEVVMNPYSTINRKIAGVLIEEELGLIAHRLRDLVEEYKNNKTKQKKIMPMITKYYPRYSALTLDQFLDLHNSKPIEEVYYFNVGCFSDFTPEKVSEWMDELDIESQSEILMPESELTDLKELKDNLPSEEYEKIVESMKGKFRPVEKKLQCGWMTLEELYHIPSYSSKVTTSLFGVDVNPKRDEPILGKSRYRETGQKIEEMSLSALLSRNARQYISSARKDTAREQNQIFLNNLLGLGLTVTDSKGYNQGGSKLKEDFIKMKNKYGFRPKKM